MRSALVAAAWVSYLALGLVQLAAIRDGIVLLLGVNQATAGFASFWLTYIPLVGPALGVTGAMSAWDWSFLGAALLFGSPYALFFVAWTMGRPRFG